MIRYTLRCERDHEFESWFQSSAAFDRQVGRGLVTCPACGSANVAKSIMAPRLARGREPDKTAAVPRDAAPPEAAAVPLVSAKEQELRAKLKELRDHLTARADNVGGQFPEEARKMHYGEIEHRPIYGEATPGEARSLHEEGVEFFPLPILPDERN
jgi:hypothetical protein